MLINALVVVAVISAMAAGLLARGATMVARFDTIVQADQTHTNALAAEHLALLILEQDMNSSTTDNLNEAWAKDELSVPTDQGTTAARIFDLQGRLDINSLRQPDDKLDAAVLDALSRLVPEAGGEGDLATRIAEWVLPEDTPLAAAPGAAQEPSGPPPHRRLAVPSEMRMISGMDPSVFDRLSPWVATLPQALSINVNTAPPEVLRAAIAGSDAREVDRLVAERTRAPFGDLADFRTRAVAILSPDGLASLDALSLSVSSEWFLIESFSRLSRTEFRMYSMVHRDPNAGTAEVVLRGGAPL